MKALLRRNLIAEVPSGSDDTEWRRDEGGIPLTLTLTDAGMVAIGLGPDAVEPAAGDVRRKKAKPCSERELELFRKGSKGAAIVRMLGRKTGGTLADLMEASGWQAHSVRGFLSGTLKKKHGLTVESEKAEDGIRRYRIPA